MAAKKKATKKKATKRKATKKKATKKKAAKKGSTDSPFQSTYDRWLSGQVAKLKR